MPVTINGFGGPIVWLMGKYHSDITSKIALTVAAKHYERDINKYIEYFNLQEEEGDAPIFLNCMIETINRCNGTCSFCPAAKHTEKRPYKKMSEDMFRSIIHDLKTMKWEGTLFLNINNEPFLDNRLLLFAEIAKRELPGIRIELISNGTLLSEDIIYSCIGKIDRLIINDYSDKYRLSEPHRSIYRTVKTHSKAFEEIDICINRRYSKEILATRAGYAPNKTRKNNTISSPCIYPFTDFLIFPDGQVGMCCNDCEEISKFGDVTQNKIVEIWYGDKYRTLRAAMRTGDRRNYDFCRECDVVDAGGRENLIRKKLESKVKRTR